MTTITNANSIGGAEVHAPKVKVGPQQTSIHVQRFSKVCQHYISNAGQSITPTFNNAGTFSAYNEGWALLDYTRLDASMSSVDKDTIRLAAKKYRIIDQGFHLKRINCLQQSVNPSTSTTQVNSTYTSTPSVMMFKDVDQDLYESVFNSGEVMSDTSQPAWKAGDAIPNARYSVPFASTLKIGALAPVKIVMKGNAPNSDSPSNFTLMKGGDIEWLSAGDTHTHSWTNPHSTWFSPSIAPIGENIGRGAPFGTSVDLIDNTIEMFSDASDCVPEGKAIPPTIVLMRVPPIRDTLGPITLLFELIVEYWCTIEWVVGRYLTTINPTTTTEDPLTSTRRYLLADKRNLRNVVSDLYTVAERRLQTGVPAKRARVVEEMRSNDTE